MAGSLIDRSNTPTPGGELAAAPHTTPRPPFDTLRDYVAAPEAHGLLLRIPDVDQDAFQATQG